MFDQIAKMTEDIRQKKYDRRQKTKYGKQMTEDKSAVHKRERGQFRNPTSRQKIVVTLAFLFVVSVH